MRRPSSALARVFLGTALTATSVSAQQSPPAISSVDGSASAPASGEPVNPARGARHLLRNGWDYITYQEYDRALAFFREAETRQVELTPADRLKLKQGVERAQRGLREAANGMTTGPAYAQTVKTRPGALALATTPAEPRYEREPIQLASADSNAAGTANNVRASGTATAVAVASTATAVETPPPIPATPEIEVAPAIPVAQAPVQAPAPVDPAAVQVQAQAPAPVDPATVPAQTQAPAAAPVQAALPEPVAVSELPPPPQDIPLPDLPEEPGATSTPATSPVTETPKPAEEAPKAAEAPKPAPEAAPTRIAVSDPAQAPTPAPAPGPEVESLPPLPEGGANAPVVEAPPAAATETIPVPAPVPVAEPTPAPAAEPTPAPVADPTPPVPAVVLPDTPPAAAPAAMVPTPAPAPAPTPAPSRGRFGIDTLVPDSTKTPHVSTLNATQLREVEEVAQRQEDEMKRKAAAGLPSGDPADAPATPAIPGSTRLEIQRAPSPTEARPLRAIPVPEEFVPLAKRDWQPDRKYWAAAATPHLPLYFQDASLERYGYSVEQHFGRFGRYMSIPVDDPRQSKQRNQIAQPFFSMGLFAAQIALLPYNMIMDPPWEAEYDLGYYRPGDRVPPDTFYLPLFGVGPPLKGSNYAVPPSAKPSGFLPPSRW